MKTPRQMMIEALAHVLTLTEGTIPGGRTDVDVDPTGDKPARIWPPNPIETGAMVRVYGDQRQTPCVQMAYEGVQHTANVRKGNKLGPVKSW